MSRKYKFRDQDKIYFVSFAVVYWIDLFIRNEYKNILLDSWNHCITRKGMELHGYCIMTSHVHMILGTPHLAQVYRPKITNSLAQD